MITVAMDPLRKKARRTSSPKVTVKSAVEISGSAIRMTASAPPIENRNPSIVMKRPVLKLIRARSSFMEINLVFFHAKINVWGWLSTSS